MEVKVTALGAARKLKSLPRIGTLLPVACRLSRLTWLGCGPGESYPDRKGANDWGVYSGDVDQQHTDYIVPSECGGKADMHWVALTDPTSPGHGLCVSYLSSDNRPPPDKLHGAVAGRRPNGTKGAQLSASRWTVAEIMQSRHRQELPSYGDVAALQARPIQLHVDTAHMGVGAAGYGPGEVWAVAPQFYVRAEAEPWTYDLRLRPLSAGTGQDGSMFLGSW